MNKLRTKQTGLAVIEFTIVSSVLLLVLFSIMDAGRYMYTAQILNDITRKTARMAAVCKVEDKNSMTTLSTITSHAPSQFSVAANLTIDYIGLDGQSVPTPASNYSAIVFVRATVSNVAYQSFSLLSIFTSSNAFPDFVTEVPVESLGVLKPTKNRNESTTDC